jgi:cytochrome b6-f complex iron-sulfur subunit
MERRNFLRNIFGGTIILWLGGIFYFLLSYLSYARKGKEVFPRVKIPSREISPSKPALIKVGEEHVWLIENEGEIFSAISAVCTHKRCILEWDRESKRFICPCHKGIFDKEGNPIFGPPSKPLKRFNVFKKGDEIIVSD